MADTEPAWSDSDTFTHRGYSPNPAHPRPLVGNSDVGECEHACGITCAVAVEDPDRRQRNAVMTCPRVTITHCPVTPEHLPQPRGTNGVAMSAWTEDADYAVVRALVDMARAMGRACLAEGVESPSCTCCAASASRHTKASCC
jgi:hypothetical protein